MGRKRNQNSSRPIPISEFRTEIKVVIIVVTSIVCFISSLNGEFVYDDSEAIVNNADVKPSTSVWQLFYNDFWGTRLTRKESHKSYRPITVLTFKLNVALTGGVIDPVGFHEVNILLHAIVSCISLFVFETLYGDNHNKHLSFLAAMFFAVHPVHTEAIAGIVGRADLLCTLFSFCALLTYTRGVKYSESITNSLIFTVIATVLSACAMFAKEQGITSIGICSMYDILIAHEIHPLNVFRWFKSKLVPAVKPTNVDSSVNKMNTKSVKLLFLRHVVLFLGGVTLLILRFYIMGGIPPVFQKVDNPASFVEDTFLRILNYNYIYALNAWLLICPVWLCCDWSMGCIPLLTSVMDSRVFAVIVFWIVILSLFVAGLKSTSSLVSRSVLMSLAFIILTFLPASNLLFTVGFVVAERVLYLPSAGFCMLVALGFKQLYSVCNHKYVLHLCLIVLLVTYSLHSYKQSINWQNERSLFLSAVTVCPLNAKIHYNLGKSSPNQSLAVECYREAIRLNPEYDQAMNNLANILKDEGSYKEAESLLRQAVELRPDFAAAWMNLGIVLSHINNYSEAEKCYANAIKFRKRYPDCYYNLGNLYLGKKLYKEALDSWKKATFLQPTHKVAWNNMIIMLDSIGNITGAVEVGKEALAVLPNDPAVHFSMANALGKLGRFEEAETHFKEAISLKSDYALYYVNLGVLYHRWKKLDLAKTMYKQALKIDPNTKSAKDNLAMLQS